MAAADEAAAAMDTPNAKAPKQVKAGGAGKKGRR